MLNSSTIVIVILFGKGIVCYGFTPIRNIITSQALTSSLLNSINEEFVTDTNVIKDLFQYHLHVQADILYTGLFVATAYLQYTMFIDKRNWDDIDLYQIYRRRFNMILTVLFIVFVRNIDNAI
jgi:hypothetical protein